MTTDERPVKTRLIPFLVYLVLFFSVWVVWVLAIYPRLVLLGERTLLYALVNNSLRLVIWVLPVFLYLRYVDHVDPVAYLKLKSNWKIGIIVGVAFTLVNFLLSAAAYGIPPFNSDALTWNSIIGTSFLIGFVEEIPFRGFVLQKLNERMSFWAANVISSLLFLLIHFPGWIALHLYNTQTAAIIFVFGFVMAVLLRYTRSLWGPIVAHSGNDLVSFLILHR